MSLKYEPASEPLHISVKWLFWGRGQEATRMTPASRRGRRARLGRACTSDNQTNELIRLAWAVARLLPIACLSPPWKPLLANITAVTHLQSGSNLEYRQGIEEARAQLSEMAEAIERLADATRAAVLPF